MHADQGRETDKGNCKSNSRFFASLRITSENGVDTQEDNLEA